MELRVEVPQKSAVDSGPKWSTVDGRQTTVNCLHQMKNVLIIWNLNLILNESAVDYGLSTVDLLLNNRQHNSALEFAPMVDGIIGYNPRSFVVIVASGIHISIKAREVGATHLDADAVSFIKIVGGTHGGQLNFVDLSFFHPYFLVVSFSVAYPLDGFV